MKIMITIADGDASVTTADLRASTGQPAAHAPAQVDDAAINAGPPPAWLLDQTDDHDPIPEPALDLTQGNGHADPDTATDGGAAPTALSGGEAAPTRLG